jgi:hypothetical protein
LTGFKDPKTSFAARQKQGALATPSHGLDTWERRVQNGWGTRGEFEQAFVGRGGPEDILRVLIEGEDWVGGWAFRPVDGMTLTLIQDVQSAVPGA